MISGETLLSFVIPVHNEEQSLRALHGKIRDLCEREGLAAEVIFVDDGSTDGSFQLLSTLAGEDDRVTVIRFRRNFGQTAALSAGIHKSRGPIIVTLDADLQNDPCDVPAILRKLDEGFDVVSGWRKKRKDGVLRRLPSIMANALISGMTGVRLSDYGCTLKAYRREYLESVPLYGDMHRFIPVYAAWHGARITEIPVTHRERQHGRSHYGLFGRTGRVLLDLLTVKFLNTFLTRPMHFFGGIGGWLIILGLLSGVTTVALKVLHIRDFVATPLPLITVFLITIGIQALLLGLLAELLIRIYFEQPGHRAYRIEQTIPPDSDA